MTTPLTFCPLPPAELVGCARFGGHNFDWMAWLGVGLIAAALVWRAMQ